jgi:quercetin dioxygenase-like cupin family protein
MSAMFDVNSLAWQAVRPDVAQGAFGKTIFDDQVKVVLTRLEPGAKFMPHRDKYGHVLYFQSGEGYVRVGEQKIVARPGIVVQVSAGEEHEYGNSGTQDLILISLNIPASS